MPLISEEQLEREMQYLFDSADTIGKAKEEAIRADKMLKHHLAIAMKHSGQKTSAAQERDALISDSYVKAIERNAITAGEYEKAKALREAAVMRIEVWRSSNANYRALKV